MEFFIKLRNFLLYGEWGIFFIVGFICKHDTYTVIIKANNEKEAIEKLKKKYCEDIKVITIRIY